MLESPSDPSAPSNPASIKRYAPPNQRSRGLNRRKSGDRLEKSSSLHGSDVDKNITAAFRGAPGDVRNTLNEGHNRRMMSLNGCARSEAFQLLHNRWEATIDCYNDPEVDLSERPVMYISAPGPAWTNFRLPHQLLSASKMDFLGELHRALQDHNANSTG